MPKQGIQVIWVRLVQEYRTRKNLKKIQRGTSPDLTIQERRVLAHQLQRENYGSTEPTKNVRELVLPQQNVRD